MHCTLPPVKAHIKEGTPQHPSEISIKNVGEVKFQESSDLPKRDRTYLFTGQRSTPFVSCKAPYITYKFGHIA